MKKTHAEIMEPSIDRWARRFEGNCYAKEPGKAWRVAQLPHRDYAAAKNNDECKEIG